LPVRGPRDGVDGALVALEGPLHGAVLRIEEARLLVRGGDGERRAVGREGDVLDELAEGALRGPDGVALRERPEPRRAVLRRRREARAVGREGERDDGSLVALDGPRLATRDRA